MRAKFAKQQAELQNEADTNMGKIRNELLSMEEQHKVWQGERGEGRGMRGEGGGAVCRPFFVSYLGCKNSEVGVVGYHKSLTRTGPWVRFPYLVLFFFFFFPHINYFLHRSSLLILF